MTPPTRGLLTAARGWLLLTGLSYVVWTGLAWGLWALLALNGSVVVLAVILESWVRHPTKGVPLRALAVLLALAALAAAGVGIGYLLVDHDLHLSDYFARFGPLATLVFPVIATGALMFVGRAGEGDPDG